MLWSHFQHRHDAGLMEERGSGEPQEQLAQVGWRGSNSQAVFTGKVPGGMPQTPQHQGMPRPGQAAKPVPEHRNAPDVRENWTFYCILNERWAPESIQVASPLMGLR